VEDAGAGASKSCWV